MELAETASTHIVDNTFAIYCFKKEAVLRSMLRRKKGP